MNTLRELCEKIEAGYASGKCGYASGMLDMILELADKTAEIKALIDQAPADDVMQPGWQTAAVQTAIPHAALIRGILDGRVVQYRDDHDPTWVDLEAIGFFDHVANPRVGYTYRLKPETVRHWHPSWKATDDNGTWIGPAYTDRETAFNAHIGAEYGPSHAPDAVVCIEQDPDTLEILSARTEAP